MGLRDLELRLPEKFVGLWGHEIKARASGRVAGKLRDSRERNVTKQVAKKELRATL